MSLLVPVESKITLLKISFGSMSLSGLSLKLYVNDITPGDGDTVEDYVEASGFGYLPQHLTGNLWTFDQGPPVTAEYPWLTFSFSGALGPVYGYYVVTQTTNKLLWAERFANAPFVITGASDTIKILPKFQVGDM
jgi:hypothetical protein